MTPGIFKEDLKVDVMLITEAHGGYAYDERNWIEPGITPQEEKKHTYLNDPIKTHHIYEVRSLLSSLEKDINWYLTDLIKCYVYKTEKKLDNFNIASEHCFENYLKNELVEISPSITVIFGGRVLKFLKKKSILRNRAGNFFNFTSKEIDANLKRFSAEEKIDVPIFIALPFPSQNAADAWSKAKYAFNEKFGISNEGENSVARLMKEAKYKVA